MSTLGDASVDVGQGGFGADNEQYVYVGQYTGSGGPPTSVTLRSSTYAGTANVKLAVLTGPNATGGPTAFVSSNNPGAEGIVTVTSPGGTGVEYTSGTLAGTSNINTNDHVYVGILADASIVTHHDGTSGTNIHLNFGTSYAAGFAGNVPVDNTYGGDPIISVQVEIDDGPGLTSVENDLQNLWNVLTSVENGSQAQWNLLNSVENGSQAQWNLLNSVESSDEFKWHLHGKLRIGVGTHMGQAGNTVYQSWTNVKAALDDLGVIRYRDENYWSYLETVQGVIDPSASTQAMQDAAADVGGYTGVLIAAYGNSFYGGDQPDDPTARAAFADYWDVLVTNWSGDFESFEVWNEWNLGAGNPGNTPDGTAADYALLVDELTLPAKPPEVMTGAVGDDTDWAWTDAFFATGSQSDHLSVHLYNHSLGANGIPEEMFQRLEALQAILRGYNGGSDFPVSVTEVGWPTHTAGDTELISGSYLARFLLEVRAYNWVQSVYIYDLFDDGTDPANREHNFGLYDNSRVEKAGTKYVKAAISFLDDWTYQDRRDVTGRLRILHFAHNSNGRHAYIVFTSEKDGTDSAVLNYVPQAFEVPNLGTLSTAGTSNYSVSEEPQIIITAAPEEVVGSLVQTGTATANGTSSAPSVTHGLTINSGDLIVAFIHNNSTATVSDNNGAASFTEDYSVGIATGGQRATILTRIADGTEGASFDFTLSSAQRWGLQIRVFSNPVASNIWNVQPSVSTFVEGTGQGLTAPDITTTAANCEALVFYGTDTGATTTYNNVGNAFGDKLEEPDSQPAATFRKNIATAGSVGATSVSASTGSITFAISMALNSNASTSSVNNPVSFEWNVLNQVLNSSTAQWNVLQSVFASNEFQWSLVQNVDGNIQVDWDILASLSTVSGSTQLLWHALNVIDGQIQLDWNALISAENGSSLQWNVLNQVSNGYGLNWNLLVNVNSLIQLDWDVLSSLASVQNSFSLVWNLSQTIDRAFSFHWDLFNAVGVSAELQWDIANSVAQQLALNWHLFENVDGPLAIQWDSLETIEGDLNIRWTILTETFRIPVQTMTVNAEDRIMTVVDVDRIMKIES